MIYCFLAGGFEEIEAIAPIDILRRAELDVTVVGVGGLAIVGSHGIAVGADITDSEVGLPDDIEAVILPGGMPGTLNLERSEVVSLFIEKAVEKGALIGAICAAPSILGKRGLLAGRKATCFDGFECFLEGAEVVDQPAVTDGNIITARGAGAAIEFGLQMVAYLKGEKESKVLRKGMKCPQ